MKCLRERSKERNGYKDYKREGGSNNEEGVKKNMKKDESVWKIR